MKSRWKFNEKTLTKKLDSGASERSTKVLWSGPRASSTLCSPGKRGGRKVWRPLARTADRGSTPIRARVMGSAAGHDCQQTSVLVHVYFSDLRELRGTCWKLTESHENDQFSLVFSNLRKSLNHWWFVFELCYSSTLAYLAFPRCNNVLSNNFFIIVVLKRACKYVKSLTRRYRILYLAMFFSLRSVNQPTIIEFW